MKESRSSISQKKKCKARRLSQIVQFCENRIHFMNCSHTSSFLSGLLSMKPHFPELFRKKNMQESKEEGRHRSCDFGTESMPVFQHLSPWLKECSQAAVLNLH